VVRGVLCGQAKQAPGDVLCAEFDRGVAQHPDYANRPVDPDAATQQRAGLVACGLGSCPQFSVAGYPDSLAPGRIVVCGLAVGHPDESVPVNGFRPGRAALEEYVR
jgi:hypothetical protein